MLFDRPDLFGAGVVWDGALHNWQSLTANRPAVASGQFGNDQVAFDAWSPWAAAARVQDNHQPLMIVQGGLTDFYNQYTNYLLELGHEPALVETTCGHDIACLTDAAGDEAMTFLAKVTTQTTN